MEYTSFFRKIKHFKTNTRRGIVGFYFNRKNLGMLRFAWVFNSDCFFCNRIKKIKRQGMGLYPITAFFNRLFCYAYKGFNLLMRRNTILLC